MGHQHRSRRRRLAARKWYSEAGRSRVRGEMRRLRWQQRKRRGQRSAGGRARDASRRQAPGQNRRKLLALCYDGLRLCAAGHAVQRVEVTDQRRDLCSGCLYFEPQRHHRGRRYDGRADAAKSKNAKPGRLRDIFAGKMKRASRFFPIPRDHAQPQDREGARPRNSRQVARARRRGDRMIERREFITLLGGAAAAGPLAARAQQLGKLPVIGYMGQGTPAAEAKRVAAFVERLRELSWIEGRTVVIEYRWTDGRSDLAADIAAEFARRKVDIIVPSGTPLIVAAKQATATIPIVFSVAGDPVGSGLVASLARPGGNVTGLSVLSTDLAGKRLDLLRELVPGLHRVAIMGNVDNPVIVQELGEYQAAAGVLGLNVIISEIRRVTDIAPAIDAL